MNVFSTKLMFGTKMPLQMSPTSVWYILPHCLQASFQNNKYQLWLANYVFEIYFLVEVRTEVGDTLYYVLHTLQ